MYVNNYEWQKNKNIWKPLRRRISKPQFIYFSLLSENLQAHVKGITDNLNNLTWLDKRCIGVSAYRCTVNRVEKRCDIGRVYGKVWRWVEVMGKCIQRWVHPLRTYKYACWMHALTCIEYNLCINQCKMFCGTVFIQISW